jgi:hypothetical protein
MNDMEDGYLDRDAAIALLRRCRDATIHFVDAIDRGRTKMKTAGKKEDAAYLAAFRRLAGYKATNDELDEIYNMGG